MTFPYVLLLCNCENEAHNQSIQTVLGTDPRHYSSNCIEIHEVSYGMWRILEAAENHLETRRHREESRDGICHSVLVLVSILVLVLVLALVLVLVLVLVLGLAVVLV